VDTAENKEVLKTDRTWPTDGFVRRLVGVWRQNLACLNLFEFLTTLRDRGFKTHSDLSLKELPPVETELFEAKTA
jgi:hypothetical protein